MIEYNKNNPLRCFFGFVGYDSQQLALQRLKANYPDFAYECVGWSDIDRNAILAHNALFPEDKDKNYGDISKIDWAKVPDFDLFTMSSPCFVKGTLILTDKGYKEIQNIRVGDRVLTHMNRFCVVEKVGHKPSNDIYEVTSGYTPSLLCTGNHPFYARKRDSSPEWIEAENLPRGRYVGYAINNESIIPKVEGIKDTHLENRHFWFLLGRCRVGYEMTAGYGMTFEVGGMGLSSCLSAVQALGYAYRMDDDTHLTIYSKELLVARGRITDGDILNLPRHLLYEYFLAYKRELWLTDKRFADGENGIWAHGKADAVFMTGIIAKVHRTLPFCLLCNEEDDTFVLSYFPDPTMRYTPVYEEDGLLWFPVVEVFKVCNGAEVYNMQVAEDHTYTANGIVVHNCQDFSQSGKRRGGEEGSGTRSSLLWECTKAIEIKRPKYVFFENVKGLITSQFVKGFHKWQARLEGLGYANFAQILNASDYGVPQNRERVFMVSILRGGQTPRYYFPKRQRLNVKVKDLLERDVSEEYYLSEEALANFCTHNNGGDAPGGEWRGEDVEPILQCADGTSPTITASCGNMGAANLRDLGHFPIQGAMVKGDYHEEDD